MVAACLLGLHLNHFVPRSIFIVYGLSAIFAGLLYVAPPFSFCRRVGGEVVLSKSLGLLPVLGAYLIQVGDLTRTVYLASLPLVVSTGLWVWTDELVSRIDDERTGRKTMVILFGPRFSGRFGVLALLILLYATIFLAVFSTSIMPLALIALLSLGFAWKIIAVSWNEYANEKQRLVVRKNAIILHLITCIIITASSLTALLI